MIAPEEMPGEDALLGREAPAMASESSSETSTTSSITSRSRISGTKFGADALDLVRAGFAAREQRRVERLDGDDLHARLALLQHLADARDRAAGAEPGDEDVDGCRRCRPRSPRRWWRGGARGSPRSRTGAPRIALSVAATISSAFSTAPRMPSGPGVSTISAPSARITTRRSDAHRLGHREHDAVAARGADERERDAGVAARPLDDRAAGLELAGRLGGVDDRDADAVLHAAAGVVELELAEHGGVGSVGDPVEAHERRASDRLRHVVVDAGTHACAPSSGRCRWRGQPRVGHLEPLPRTNPSGSVEHSRGRTPMPTSPDPDVRAALDRVVAALEAAGVPDARVDATDGWAASWVSAAAPCRPRRHRSTPRSPQVRRSRG